MTVRKKWGSVKLRYNPKFSPIFTTAGYVVPDSPFARWFLT
jgi:hypothetical protein